MRRPTTSRTGCGSCVVPHDPPPLDVRRGEPAGLGAVPQHRPCRGCGGGCPDHGGPRPRLGHGARGGRDPCRDGHGRLVATLHSTERGRHQGWLPTELARTGVHQIEAWLVAQSSRVITCSTAMAAEVLAQFDGGRRIDVIANGVDADRWRVRAGPRARPLLVFAGRLEWEKGVVRPGGRPAHPAAADPRAAAGDGRRGRPARRTGEEGAGPSGSAARRPGGPRAARASCRTCSPGPPPSSCPAATSRSASLRWKPRPLVPRWSWRTPVGWPRSQRRRRLRRRSAPGDVPVSSVAVQATLADRLRRGAGAAGRPPLGERFAWPTIAGRYRRRVRAGADPAALNPPPFSGRRRAIWRAAGGTERISYATPRYRVSPSYPYIVALSRRHRTAKRTRPERTSLAAVATGARRL